MKESANVRYAGAIAALAIGSASLLAACGTTSGIVDTTTEAAAAVLLPPSQEAQLGQQMKAQLDQELKMHPDPKVQQYIDRLGAQVVRAAGDEVPDGVDINFHVVDDPNTVNAFAIPGGDIYIYSGLLLQADTEAEVVGVLGHEVAHVTERHIAERLVQTYGIQTLASVALGQNPGMLAQILAGVTAQGYVLKYGRDQESESDRTGLKYTIDAGYDPQGMVTFFQKLDQSSPGRTPTILASHPHPGDRAQDIKNSITRDIKNPPTKTGRETYQAMKPSFRGGAAAAPAALLRATPTHAVNRVAFRAGALEVTPAHAPSAVTNLEGRCNR